jgi:ABC-type Fe3+-hydroxamate transport system substrate-binding protein
MTQTAIDLGAERLIVGRTPWCATRNGAVVGTLQDRDLSRIVELRPSLVLVQASELDRDLEHATHRVGAHVLLQHVDRLEDILVMAQALAEQLDQAGVPDALRRLAEIKLQFEAGRELGRPAVTGAGRTLLLFAADPPTAFGGGTYVDDLWQSMGGVNTVSRTGYPELSLEDIVRMDPERILLIRSTPGPASDALHALPQRLRARVRVCHAPVLLDPSTAFLRQGPSELQRAAEANP